MCNCDKNIINELEGVIEQNEWANKIWY
jgi:hypothetical protein